MNKRQFYAAAATALMVGCSQKLAPAEDTGTGHIPNHSIVESVRETYYRTNTILDCEFGILTAVTVESGVSSIDLVASNPDSKRANTARAKCKSRGIEPGF